ERHRDRRRDDRLYPDPQDPPDLFAHDRREPDQVDAHEVDAALLAERAGELGFEGGLPLGHGRAPLCLASTSRMKSSSRRFVFVRIVTTVSPCFVSSSNILFKPCSLATSTSISCSLRRRTV